MTLYTFKFKVQISKSSNIEGVYSVREDDYISAELHLKECLQYGFGKDADIEIDLTDDSLKTAIGKSAA